MSAEGELRAELERLRAEVERLWAEMRERVWRALADAVVDSEPINAYVSRPLTFAESGGGEVLDDLTDAVLAVVGQGVTAECDHARAARDLMRTYPGTLSDATALVDAFAQADRSAVRSGEQGGAG